MWPDFDLESSRSPCKKAGQQRKLEIGKLGLIDQLVFNLPKTNGQLLSIEFHSGIFGVEILDYQGKCGSADPLNGPASKTSCGLVAVGGGRITSTDSHTELSPSRKGKTINQENQQTPLHAQN